MILEQLDIFSEGGALSTASVDMNVAVNNVAVIAGLGSIFSTDNPLNAFAGIQEFITEDPNTGAVTVSGDLSAGLFNLSTAIFIDDAASVTFVVGGTSGDGGWFTTSVLAVNGFCQLIFNQGI